MSDLAALPYSPPEADGMGRKGFEPNARTRRADIRRIPGLGALNERPPGHDGALSVAPTAIALMRSRALEDSDTGTRRPTLPSPKGGMLP